MTTEQRPSKLIQLHAYRIAITAVLSLSACGGGGGGNASPPPAPVPVTYSVGGTTSGLSGSGLVLRNNGGDNRTVSANGTFTFATALASGATYSVTVLTQPTSPSQTCDVTNGSGTVSAGNVTNIAVTCVSPGFVVAARANPVEINIYRADQPNVPIETIAGATFTDSLLDAAGTRLGMVYGKFATPGVYFELGVFRQSQRVVLAGEGGHTYTYLGLIDGTPRRVVFRDTLGADVGVRTATLDGVDDHLVKSGCVNVTMSRFSSSGVIFLCEEGGAVKKIYYTDGVAPAVYMTGSNFRVPLALTPMHAITGDVNPLMQLHTQALAGALGGAVQPDQDLFTSGFTMDNGADELLAVNPQGIVLGRTFYPTPFPQPWEAWSVNADLSVNDGNPHSRHRSFGAPLLIELSPDGLQAAVIYQNKDGAGQPHKGAVINLAQATSDMAPFNPLYLQTAPATTFMSDIHFLAGGKFAGTWGPQGTTTALYVYNADGTVFSQVSGHAGSNFVDTIDDYLLYVGGTPIQLFNSSLINGTADLNLSPAAQQPLPTLRNDGYVTFVDDANLPWIASADPKIPTALRLRQQIDGVATDAVENVGDGPGSRMFFTLYRSNGDRDVVMFDLDDRTTTPIVSGATYDTGFYFPN